MLRDISVLPSEHARRIAHKSVTHSLFPVANVDAAQSIKHGMAAIVDVVYSTLFVAAARAADTDARRAVGG